MVASGELQAAEGSKKVSGKKKLQDDKASEGTVKLVKTTGKRKRWEDDATANASGDEYIPVGAISRPASVPSADTAAQPHHLDTNLSSTRPTTTPLLVTSLAPTTSASGAVSSTKIGRTPTLGGLQRELNDLRSLMTTVLSNQEQMSNDLTMVRGWCEVLIMLKDQMIVSVPALQAEMTGLRNGMELERMKSHIATLDANLSATKTRLAQFEDETTDDDEDTHQLPQDDPPLHISLPKSSMYVPPNVMRQSIRQSSPMPGVFHHEIGRASCRERVSG